MILFTKHPQAKSESPCHPCLRCKAATFHLRTFCREGVTNLKLVKRKTTEQIQEKNEQILKKGDYKPGLGSHHVYQTGIN